MLLRLKGNYLWPAVWSRSLFDDDPANQALAAEYGVVMGTSHEAPMMRAQDEWNRYGQATGPYGGTGEFSFVRNAEALERYWADGLRRMNGFESIITVGMRGNGDTGMEDAQGIELMQQIVTTQRQHHRRGHPEGPGHRSAGVVAVQGSPAVLGRRHARAGRRHHQLV